MKRRPPTAASLVEYSESGSENEDEQPEPPPKKRKLPPLSSTLLLPAPVDNPFLHQGRTRTKPHVDGQFAAYVYVPLILDDHPPLGKLLLEVIKSAKEMVPTLQDIVSGVDAKQVLQQERELHLSLSRPIYLRAHQREEMKRAIKLVSASTSSFSASFATFAALTNEEGTRTFLTMEVGAGHEKLQRLSDALSPALNSIRQETYYATPRYHVSLAWALLDAHPPSISALGVSPDASAPSSFATIPHFPSELIPTLNARYGGRLAAPSVGTFDVESVSVKIGKEASQWGLRGV